MPPEGQNEAGEIAAARQALTGFGLAGARFELASRSENVTFRVEAGGEAYALRLHRPGYQNLAELNSERVWTGALSGAGIPVPAGVTTADGRCYVPAGGWLAGMTRWVPGHNVAAGEAMFTALGGIAARLHAHSSTWRPPANFTRRRLDADGLMGDDPNWGRFWDHAALTRGERALMARTREALHGALGDLAMDGARFGMIHADLHGGNLLVDGETLTVIDFDDAAFGWYLYDLAVALVVHGELQDALLAGYRARRALTAEDEARLPLFILIRRLAVIGWLHQRREIDAGARLAEMIPTTCAMCEAFLGGGAEGLL